MDIDLEDQLRSEIDDLRFEIEELREHVKWLSQALFKQNSPPVQFEIPKKSTWDDGVWGNGSTTNAKYKSEQATKIQRQIDLLNIMESAGSYVDKDEWAKQWQAVLWDDDS